MGRRNGWAVKIDADGQVIASFFKRKGGRYHCSPAGSIDGVRQLSGDVYLSIGSRDTVVVHEDFPAMKSDVLRLHMEKKLDQMAMFDIGEPVAITSKALSSDGRLQTHVMVALPEKHLASAVDRFVPLSAIRLKCCLPMVASVAALLAQADQGPWVLLLINRGDAMVLGVRNGVPLFLQNVTMSDPAHLDTEAVIHGIDFCRQSLRRDFGLEECAFLRLGSERDSISIEQKGYEEKVPDWSRTLAVDIEDLISFPSLYGALFLDSGFSFLPPEYHHGEKLKKVSYYLAAAAAVASVGLGGVDFVEYRDLQPVRERLNSLEQKYNKSLDYLNTIMPDSKTAELVTKYSEIYRKIERDLDVSILIQQIALSLPEQVFVNDLFLKRKNDELTGSTAENVEMVPAVASSLPAGPGESAETGKDMSEAEKLLDMAIEIRMSCAAVGDYAQVKNLFEKTVEGLRRYFILQDIEWRYSEDESRGLFQCELALRRTGM